MEEKIYLELLKAALKIATDSFNKIIVRINDSRLENKKKKIENKKKVKNKHNRIELSQKERLSGQISLDYENASQNIQNHIIDIERWSRIIKFSDLNSSKTLGAIYIQLDTYLVPIKKHFSKIEKNNTLPLETAIMSGKEHCVILGQPGAGKTTSLKKICNIIINEESDSKYTFPILIRFRHLEEFSSPSPILNYISDIINIKYEFSEHNESISHNDILKVKEEAIISFLNFVSPMIILDGFDELKDSKAKETILNELKTLTNRLTESKIILSCRTGEFNYELEYSKTFEIAPLNNNQIELFVHKWLDDVAKAKDFLNKVKNSPFSDTSIKPLSLAHLCTIYERIGNIPAQPKTIYKKVVNLLIEEWDEQRFIIRKSAFDGFQTDQKFEFLTHLSFFLTTHFKTSTFSISQFIDAYENIYEYHSLPKNKGKSIVKELESHTGLFVESGYDKFEFVHKSIQEYLTAYYIVKLPSLNSIKNNFDTLGSELAIAVSISSNSSLYFIELVLNYISRLILPSEFFSSFTSRLIAEKPAFKQEELISVTILVLISNWVNPGGKKLNQYKGEFYDIDKYSNFFDLSESMELAKQRVKIFKYYKFQQSLHDNMFVELIRTTIPEVHKRLPSKIYIPIEVFEEFNK